MIPFTFNSHLHYFISTAGGCASMEPWQHVIVTSSLLPLFLLHIVFRILINIIIISSSTTTTTKYPYWKDARTNTMKYSPVSNSETLNSLTKNVSYDEPASPWLGSLLHIDQLRPLVWDCIQRRSQAITPQCI